MENASKALLMAGGVLIALLIIALLIRSFTTVKEFQLSQLSEQEQAELIAFNEQYTKYLNQYVYGTEVITVINRAKNNITYPITVKIKFANNGNGYTYKGYKEVSLCSTCGEELDYDTKFCSKCGTKRRRNKKVGESRY